MYSVKYLEYDEDGCRHLVTDFYDSLDDVILFNLNSIRHGRMIRCGLCKYYIVAYPREDEHVVKINIRSFQLRKGMISEVTKLL